MQWHIGFLIGNMGRHSRASLSAYSYFIYNANKTHLFRFFLANDRLGATNWRGRETP